MAKREQANPRDARIGSFWVTLRQAAILATRIKQVAYRRGLYTSRAVAISNLKCDPPLLEQHTIGVQETELRVVDVRCLGGHTVQLHNLYVASLHEVLPRR